MALYDIFLKNQHNDFFQNLLVENNKRLLGFLKKQYFFDIKRKIKILEVGPGKGYVKKAVDQMNGKFDYYALDRNEAILENLNLKPDKVFLKELPDFDLDISKGGGYDIVLISFVIEHLKSGFELYQTFNSIKKIMRKHAILVCMFPDCMKLKMEFWNIDHTHIFPTTKRNVNMTMREVALYVDKCININGILFERKVNSRFLYWLRRFFIFFYNYRFFSFLCKPLYHKPLYSMENVFYRAFCLLKEENVMFIAKREED